MEQVIETFSTGEHTITLSEFEGRWYVTVEEPGFRQTYSFKTYRAALADYNAEIDDLLKEIEESA